MEISYRHANPHAGRESTLLCFDGLVPDQTVGVLIDAGQNVDVDSLLKRADDEYLGAVCLTHAHLDHYRTLGENLRDGAPVYATPDTAAVLGDVLDAGRDHYDLVNTGEVLDRLESCSTWTKIVSGLHVCPVPAGHAPGAAGFLFAAADGDTHRTVLVTGDFTFRPAAGNRGLPLDLPVDAVFLTAATNDDFEETATDIVGTLCERAHTGSPVLASTSGLTGAQLAYWLGHYVDDRAPSVPIRAVGHVAKLYERLDYDVPGVESVPVFEDPTAVLENGAITIAGPEVPVEGSSGRLFDSIRDDPNAALVQVTGGGTEPTDEGRCTIHSFTLSNHPTRDVLDELIETIEPVHVVVTHQRGRAANQFTDHYDSYVWATDDSARYTLFDETGWTPPPWVTDDTVRRVQSRMDLTGQFFEEVTEAAVPLASVERSTDVDLAAEGLVVRSLNERLPTTGQRVGSSRAAAADRGLPESKRTVETDGVGEDPDAVGVEPNSHAGTGSEDDTDAETDATDRSDDEDAVSGTTAERLAAIDTRLDRIEAELDGDELKARVVDAGDGVVMLRLLESAEGLSHGDEVRVVVPEADGSGE